MKKSVKKMKKGNWRMLYKANGASEGLSYRFAKPRTSPRKRGVVRMDIRGSDMRVCRISSLTWFLRYLGWVKVAWSKMKM